jgi:hypothetical protein
MFLTTQRITFMRYVSGITFMGYVSSYTKNNLHEVCLKVIPETYPMKVILCVARNIPHEGYSRNIPNEGYSLCS